LCINHIQFLQCIINNTNNKMSDIYLWTEQITQNILSEDLETSQNSQCTVLKTIIKNDQKITGLHLAYTMDSPPALPEWNNMYQSSEYNNNGTQVITGIDVSNNSVIVEHGWSVTSLNKSPSDSTKNRLLFAGTVNQPLTSVEGASEQDEEQTLANFVNTEFNISSVIGISNETGQLYPSSQYQIGKPS
jgi:hypothetical protein